MKTTLLISILIARALVTDCSAALLIYKYVGSETQIAAGHERTLNYTGEMFFDSISNNASFVGWATWEGKKLYWSNTETNYIVATIQGIGKSYTIIEHSEVDSSRIIMGRDLAFRRRKGCEYGSSESCGSLGRRL